MGGVACMQYHMRKTSGWPGGKDKSDSRFMLLPLLGFLREIQHRAKGTIYVWVV
jgi:hypothetical protein